VRGCHANTPLVRGPLTHVDLGVPPADVMLLAVGPGAPTL
jgi:hypothetical protein